MISLYNNGTNVKLSDFVRSFAPFFANISNLFEKFSQKENFSSQSGKTTHKNKYKHKQVPMQQHQASRQAHIADFSVVHLYLLAGISLLVAVFLFL